MKRVLQLICAVVPILMLSDYSHADDQLQLVVTGTDRAIVLLNGDRVVLGPNQKTHPRMKLVSADTDRVVVQIDGNEHILETGSVAAPIHPETEVTDDPLSGSQLVTLWATPSGFFFANGSVNRRSTRFLVDTGANTITLSSVQADRLGIDYQGGKDGFASTASGITRIKSLTLARVTVEGITLRNIAANIIPGNFPEYPLLGASFLGKLNMVRSGNRMELSRR